MSIDQYFADAGGLNSRQELEVQCACGEYTYLPLGTFTTPEEAIEDAEACGCGRSEWRVA